MEKEGGYRITTIFLSGGLATNKLFVYELANITNCHVVIPKYDAMLIGNAILASTAANIFSDSFEAMKNMSKIDKIISPHFDISLRTFHLKKYRLFLELFSDQMKYRKIMSE